MVEQDTDPFAKYGGSEVKEPVQSPTSDPFAKYGGVELSKKAGGAGSPPTSTPSINGLNSFQSSPQSISPVIDPELHQKMVNDDVATYQKQQQGLKDAIGAYSQAHNGQPITTPNTSQQSVQSYQPVPLTTKLQLNARRIGANILTGITEGTVAPANYLNNKLGITDDKETARINDKINSGTGIDLGLPKSFVDNGDGTFGTNAVNGLARILPAIISSEPSYGASFALQGVGNAALKVQDLKNQGIKFNNHSDDLMILGSGLVNYALGKSVSGNVFSKLAPAVQDDITQGLAAEATRDLAKLGTDATTQDIAQAYAKQAQSFATRLGQTGIEAIKSIPAITTDFAGANLANSAIKAGVNKLSGNNPLGNVTGDEIANDVISPIYDGSTPANGDLGQFAKNILGSQAIGLGGLHGLLSGSMLNDNSPYKNPIIESLQNDNSPENIDKVKAAITQQGMADGLHPDEIEKTHDAIDKVAEIAKTIPKNLPPDKFTNAVSAVLKRNQLQEELGNQRGEDADESLKDVKTPYEQLLSDKVEQANDEVKNAVVGSKSTFSKGIGDEEGKFFKTTDGNREEITPSRYELESTERDAKANSPKETTINPIENESTNEINSPIEGQSNIDQESSPESESNQKGNGEQNNPGVSESTDANVGREEVSDGGDELPITEPKEEDSNTTSSRRSSTEKSLENVGLENTDTHDTRPKTLVEAEADKAIKDGYDIDDLIHKIKNEGHIATDTENVILAKHLGAREKEISDINADIRDNGATYSDKKLSDLSDKRDKLLQDFQDSANLTQETRRAAARALNSGNFDVKNNYSLETMILNERKDLGRKLTTEELADVVKTHQMLSDAESAYQKRIKDLEDENAKLKADKAVKGILTRSRKNLSKVELAEERKVIAQEFSTKLKAMRGSANDAFKASAEFLIAAAPYVAKMVRNLAEEGVLDLKEVIKRVKDELDMGDVSDRDITDIIGGKYSKRLTQSETAKKLAQLRAEAKLVSQIQDAEDGLRKLNPARKVVANAKLTILRQRLAELDKENGLYDAKRLDQTKTRLVNEIAKIKNDLTTGNFDKPEPTKPVNDATTLTLRRQRDFLRREYDIGQAKKALAQRTLFEKSRDNAMNVASLPRALKAAMDFSAPLRHGLFASVPHPIEGAKAFKTAIGQMFSEKKYNDWMADLKASRQYELMQNSGLYISDKSDPRLLAREEDFMSNLPEKIPIFKHIYKATERNYQGYLNALRTGVFMDAANTLGEQGYTFENNPEKFKGIAKVVNVLTGRGDIPDLLGGKNPVVLSNALFSPRFMGARIHTLYLWADPRLPKEARIMALKDIGKTVATVASFVTLAKLSGYKVNLNPNRSDFLEIKSKDGKLQYDISGGTSPYITLLSRMLTGKYTNSYGETSNMNNPQYGKPTRLTTSMNFLRGRLSTPVAMGVNLMDKKDMMGNKYGLKQLPEELVPMSMSDIHQAFKAGGITDALKSIIPAELGVGVSPTHPKKEN